MSHGTTMNTNNFDNTEEMDKSLEICNLPGLNHEGIKNL